MSDIVNKIKSIEKLYQAKGCSFKQLKDAQNELGLSFPEEFVDYVKAYGAISFYGTEWTGLNVEGYLNVVQVTKQEKELNSSFPVNCFVLENQGIDGLIVICNEEGQVFNLQYDKLEKIHDSISDYLAECLSRAK